MTFMEMSLQLKLGPLRSPPELVLDDSDKPFANERQRRNVQKKKKSGRSLGERIKGFGSKCGRRENCPAGKTPSKINSI